MSSAASLIVGLSGLYHDSAAALLRDGEVIAAAQEERFSRRKHDARFPARALAWCLGEAGIGPAELSGVVFYDRPVAKLDRMLRSWAAFAPRGLRSFRRAMPGWLGQKVDIARALDAALGVRYRGPLYYSDHHVSHAASAFFPSPFDEAAVLVVDGVGEWATTSWGVGRGRRLQLRGELRFPHSLGLLYAAFTEYCGFRVNSGEYKLMGLAPYGEPRFVDLILDHLVDLRDDGSFWLDQRYFDYSVGATMTSPRLHALLGAPPRTPEAPLDQRVKDVAASVQRVTEEILLRLARHVRAETGLDALCLAGGVALNCVANGRLLREAGFERLWVQPAAGDAGGALGAALHLWHETLAHPREPQAPDAQRGSLLGPSFGGDAVTELLDEVGARYTAYADEDELCAVVARLLDEGKVVGHFAGPMEFGPRALGNRSILADPRSPTMRDTVNARIKRREPFRPFAPAVLAERAAEYFELDVPSPYMLFTATVRGEGLPAVTHIDRSARVQTVHRERSPRFYKIIEAFAERTGCPVVLNTSLNVRGEPIACTPHDAYHCFLFTEMDALVMENTLCLKAESSPP